MKEPAAKVLLSGMPKAVTDLAEEAQKHQRAKERKAFKQRIESKPR